MYRAILTPTKKQHTVDLPEQFFGKKVEVTVVEVDGAKTLPTPKLPEGKEISLSSLFETFGMAPDFPSIEEIRTKAWPQKW